MAAHTTIDVASLADERTPLLAPPAPSPRSRLPRPHQRQRPASRPQEARDALTLPYLTRSLAAIRSGSLPSTPQLLTLSQALLDSSFLSDFHQVPYLTNAPTLSKEGEKVRSALREVLESMEELVKRRNPRVEWDEEREVWVGQTREEGTGDGWQEFVWACRRTRVDVDLPSTSIPTPSPSDLSAAHSSLLTLLQLPLTSPAFLSLLSDLVVLLRDSFSATVQKAKDDELLSAEAGETVKDVVEGVVEGVVGPEEARKKGEGGSRADESVQETKDEFVERLQQVLVQLQSTQAYQGATRTLLSLARSYIRQIADELTPVIDIDTPASPSTPRQLTDPAHVLIPLLEPFTGGPASLSPLRTSFKTLSSRLSPSNPSTTPHALSTLFSQLNSLVDRALLEPGWAGSKECYVAVGRLQDTASQVGQDDPVLRAAVRDSFSLLVDAISKVASDPLLRRTATAVEQLGEAVVGWVEVAGGKALQVVEGQPLNAIWADLVEWVWPRVVGVLAEMSLPRIEFASPAVSLAIEPPSLLSTSLVPSSISIRQTTALTYTPSHGCSTLALPLSASVPAPPPSSLSSRTSAFASTRLEVSGLRLEVENVGYFASYHTGIPCFPTLSESGLLDLRLGSNPSSGLSFSLVTSTLSSPAARTLFDLDPAETQVTLEDFRITPHHSSHPWLMWLLRPILQTAVRKVVEKEVREKVVEAGVEWVGRVGWSVKERERKLRSEEEGEKVGVRGASRGEDGAKQAVWRWFKAGWQVLLGTGNDQPSSPATPSSPASAATAAPTLDDVQLNSRGITLDLSSEEATVGLGSEGVVLSPGEASIPHPDGQKKGLRRAVRDEVRSEVREGRRVGRKVMRLPGEVEEAREEWVEYGRREQGEVLTWKSEAFDL
ncbi:hypothetical protein OF846_005154 [Rhodotorula toruloides]|nr:hypothetical protein OF846_005154 [Rhodotorula toruloides]